MINSMSLRSAQGGEAIPLLILLSVMGLLRRACPSGQAGLLAMTQGCTRN